MRRILLLVAAVSAVAALWAVPSVSAAEHPGCNGVEKALGKANEKGKAALQVVSEKLGCGGVTPDPVDPIACPAGQVSLARWSYAGALSTGVDQYGYRYWIGDPGWTLTSGTGATVVIGDGGGFYWNEAVAQSVKTIVAQSMTGEVVQVTDTPPVGDPTWVLDPSRAVSHNWFINRTGLKNLNFCGPAAA